MNGLPLSADVALHGTVGPASCRRDVPPGAELHCSERESRRCSRHTIVSDAVQTLPELSMSYRWSPLPHWPAAQAEAASGASVGAGGGVALLDAASLDRLRELDPGGRNGLLQRVLRTYTQSLERLLVQWRAARAAGDNNALRVIAHTLKSSSASVGALELSALCADVEARLRDQQHDGAEARLDALAAEAERILDGLSTAHGAST
jgi:HPt (histidine-containing phosphotransfer) domain-containing protein